jgi:hypothetical protein
MRHTEFLEAVRRGGKSGILGCDAYKQASFPLHSAHAKIIHYTMHIHIKILSVLRE